MNDKKPTPETQAAAKKNKAAKQHKKPSAKAEKEIGGFADSGLLEPTRFGDWEKNGRCIDF